MQSRSLAKSALIILSSLALLTNGVAYADDGHDKDSDAVKYRHAVMESLSNHFAAIALVFTGRVDQPGDLQIHADALAQTATTIGGLFPPGSEGGEALPLTWDEPEKVAEAAELSAVSAKALAEALAGGDRGAATKAFKAAGEACKGCHERYREDDDED